MKLHHKKAPSILQLSNALIRHRATRLAIAPMFTDRPSHAIVYVQLSDDPAAPYLIEFIKATILMSEKEGHGEQKLGDFYLDDPISCFLESLEKSEWKYTYFPVQLAEELFAHVVICLGSKLVKRINNALMTAGLPDSLVDDRDARQQ